MASTFGTSLAAIGMSIMIGMSNPSRSGSTITVVPRLLIRNPAIPSQRRVVPSFGPNPSPPNGCVFGALACCVCCIVPASAPWNGLP